MPKIHTPATFSSFPLNVPAGARATHTFWPYNYCSSVYPPETKSSEPTIDFQGVCLTSSIRGSSLNFVGGVVGSGWNVYMYKWNKVQTRKCNKNMVEMDLDFVKTTSLDTCQKKACNQLPPFISTCHLSLTMETTHVEFQKTLASLRFSSTRCRSIAKAFAALACPIQKVYTCSSSRCPP